MLDLVGNPEDRFSHNEAHFIVIQDLINLAPRKPDWDLKRDVAKKLEKLERRTQRAIAELISKEHCNSIT